MTAARTLLEASAFLTLALLLHLAWFHLQPDGAHGGPGAAGGASDVTLVAASAEMVALVEDWDLAPQTTSQPAPVEATEPLQPAAVRYAEPPAPMSQKLTPIADLDKPQTTRAPQLDLAMNAQHRLADTPAPAKPALSRQPHTLVAVRPTQSSNLRIKQPELTTPVTVQTPPIVNQSEVTPPADASPHAVKKSPTPRAKPTPPARQKRVQTMKTPAKPVAPARPKAREHSPAPQTQTTAATDGGAADQTAVAALKTDEGGASSNAAGAAKRASLARTWGRAIRKKVERNKRHPRNGRLSGKVVIAITVERGGDLLNADIRQASGSRQLDRAALNAVKAAAPYQRAPTDLKGERFDFLLPVTFRR